MTAKHSISSRRFACSLLSLICCSPSPTASCLSLPVVILITSVPLFSLTAIKLPDAWCASGGRKESQKDRKGRESSEHTGREVPRPPTENRRAREQSGGRTRGSHVYSSCLSVCESTLALQFPASTASVRERERERQAITATTDVLPVVYLFLFHCFPFISPPSLVCVRGCVWPPPFRSRFELTRILVNRPANGGKRNETERQRERKALVVSSRSEVKERKRERKRNSLDRQLN